MRDSSDGNHLARARRIRTMTTRRRERKTERREKGANGGSTTVLPKFSNPLIELRGYSIYVGGVYSEPQKQRRRRAQDHSCIRVKPRLCGAARRQATGDYNGISSRLAYELRSPSSAHPPAAAAAAAAAPPLPVPSSTYPGLTPPCSPPSALPSPFCVCSLSPPLPPSPLPLSLSLFLFLHLSVLVSPIRSCIRASLPSLPASRCAPCASLEPPS